MRKIYTLLSLMSLAASGLFAQNIINESFNTGIPGTWTVVNGGGSTDTWFGTTAGYNGNTLDGSQFAMVNSDAAGNGPHPTLSEQLISPTFNGSAYSQIILEFDQYYHVYSTDRGYVEVWNGSAWIVVQTMAANIGAWNAPNHATINLSSYSNAAMKIRFRYEDNAVWAWWWAVDNVRIYAPVTTDAQLTGATLPSNQCGYTSAESITVTGINGGIAPITSLPLRYRINGGAPVNEIYAGSIAPGASFSYTFNTPANLSAAGSYVIDVWSALPGDAILGNDSLLNNRTANHIRINNYPYTEDFEANTGGWFVTGALPSWAWGTPAKTTIQGASSGAKAWVTGGLGTTTYADNENNHVEGPCLDFSNTGGPWIGLDTWWNAEFSWDGANLQTSIDGGQTWDNVGQFGDPDNWYTDNTINGAPGGSQEGWSGRASTNNGSGGWLRSVHNLANLSGEPNVLLRINFASDASVVDDGFAFDNITVARQPSLYLGADTMVCDSLILDAGNASSWAWSTGATTQSITVTQSGNYTATIRDIFGFPTQDVIYVDIEGLRTWDLGADTILCTANNFALSVGSSAQSYLWSTGATSQQINPTTTGLYSVTATSPIGCLQTDSISLIFSDLRANINLLATVICRGMPTNFWDNSAGTPTSWYWDFGNGNLSTNQNPVTVFSAGGTFPVNLRVNDANCIDDTTILVLVEVCTSTTDPSDDQLYLYPNPTSGRLNIGGLNKLDGPVTLELHDIAGKIVWRDEIEEAQTSELQQVDFQTLSAGLYHFHVLGAAKTWSQRLIIQH